LAIIAETFLQWLGEQDVGSPEKEIAAPDFTTRYHPAGKANGLSAEQVSQQD